jgi:hypothetical protein
VILAAVAGWTNLVGMVSLELFGQYKGAFEDVDKVFEYAMKAAAYTMGL